jgi:hypothetical protein
MMEIHFSPTDRIVFTWGNGGALVVQLYHSEPDRHGELIQSTTLNGKRLADFLASFTAPLFRRALALAVDYPQQNNSSHKVKNGSMEEGII